MANVYTNKKPTSPKPNIKPMGRSEKMIEKDADLLTLDVLADRTLCGACSTRKANQIRKLRKEYRDKLLKLLKSRGSR